MDLALEHLINIQYSNSINVKVNKRKKQCVENIICRRNTRDRVGNLQFCNLKKAKLGMCLFVQKYWP